MFLKNEEICGTLSPGWSSTHTEVKGATGIMMPGRVWNVAAYVRLSCEDEDDDKKESNSISSQKEMIRAYVAAHPDLILVDEYADDGYSGVNFDRPDFIRMLADLEKKRVDCVIVKDLSRLGRDYIDTGRYLERKFPLMGVRFISINDRYDSGGEKSQSDSLLIPIKNLLNDEYCRDISTKTRSQLDVKRKMGDFIGSFAPYGYRKASGNKNKLEIDEEAAQVVEMIFRWRVQGMSNQAIADKLNSQGILSPSEYKRSKGEKCYSGYQRNEQALWYPETIRLILTNDVYIGTLTQHKSGTPNYKVKKRMKYSKDEWITVYDNHEPIIKKTDFETVQLLLGKAVRIPPNQEEVHIFSGFVYCGDCNCSMQRNTVRRGNKQYVYLSCSSHKFKKTCAPHSINEEKLKEIVFTVIKDHISAVCEVGRVLEYIANLPEDTRQVINYDAQIARQNEEIERCQNFKLRLYSDFSDEVISRDEYIEFKLGYDKKIAAAQRAISVLQEERKQAVGKSAKDAPWLSMFQQYENITELQRDVLVNLVERIVVMDSSTVVVKFRYMDQFTSACEYIKRFEGKVGA